MKLSEQMRGRWVDILTTIGIDRGLLKNKHGPCPICGGSDRFRFDNKDGEGTYYCNGCGPGDGVTLAMRYLGLSFMDAANEIREIIGECKVELVKQTDEEVERKNNENRLREIHKGLRPIAPGSQAMNYLASRGLKVLPEINCYFHASVPYYGSDRVGSYPAMVTAFRDSEGNICTYQVTYLEANGAKLKCDTPKRNLPVIRPMSGGAVRLFDHDKIIGIAEGVETALACHQLDGYPMWSTLNANMMRTVVIPKDVTDVLIYADSDKSFTGQSAAFDLANRLKVKEGKNVRVLMLIEDGPVPYVEVGMDMDFLDYLLLSDNERGN